ncbi:hypothetical protein [Caminibacter pacificus]|uniref:Uncharacterized protein n=1 Tax=Caminibacter pacificus TaxID=1424653 RepID=A0AAJ4UWZ3_9BACT|nr:hypothetical protein [Caminibacter pacificus]QDD68228.1 hypothetical protein C6V80_09735 [Caminibacter pacificus]ROR38742.1 hypothetical protein EDC58_1957 [Caminibacter pacificus]
MDIKEIEKDYFALSKIESKIKKEEKELKGKYEDKFIILSEQLESLEEFTIPPTDIAVKVNNYVIVNSNDIFLLYQTSKFPDTGKIKTLNIEKEKYPHLFVKNPLSKTDIDKLIEEEFKRIKSDFNLKIKVTEFKKLPVEEKIDFLKKYNSSLPLKLKDDGYKFEIKEQISIRRISADKVINDFISKNDIIGSLYKELEKEKDDLKKWEIISELKEEIKNIKDKNKNILEQNISILKDISTYVNVTKRYEATTKKAPKELELFSEEIDTFKAAKEFGLYKDIIKIIAVTDNPNKIKAKYETLISVQNQERRKNEIESNFFNVFRQSIS